jgi:lysophospholipase
MGKYGIEIIDFFNGFDGKKIRYGIFGEKNYSGIIFILQGRAEYFEKYQHIANHYIKKGFLAVTMDWRGQGGSIRELSDSDKGHIKDFSHYQKDFKIFVNLISTFIKPQISVYGIAHSMGGHNLLRYIIENKGSYFNKIILSSPMLGIETFPLPQKIAFFIARACVKSGLKNHYVINTGPYKEPEFINNSLTSDYQKFFENIFYLRKKREFAIGGPTYSWVYNAFLSMEYIKENILKIDENVKTKIIYGSNDRVVKIDLIKKLSKFMSEAPFEIKAGKHELMMENPEKLKIFLKEADRFFQVD